MPAPTTPNPAYKAIEAQGFISVNDAVERWGIKRMTFYSWIHKGKVETAHIGDRVFIKTDSLKPMLGPLFNQKAKTTTKRRGSRARKG